MIKVSQQKEWSWIAVYVYTNKRIRAHASPTDACSLLSRHLPAGRCSISGLYVSTLPAGSFAVFHSFLLSEGGTQLSPNQFWQRVTAFVIFFWHLYVLTWTTSLIYYDCIDLIAAKCVDTLKLWCITYYYWFVDHRRKEMIHNFFSWWANNRW